MFFSEGSKERAIKQLKGERSNLSKKKKDHNAQIKAIKIKISAISRQHDQRISTIKETTNDLVTLENLSQKREENINPYLKEKTTLGDLFHKKYGDIPNLRVIFTPYTRNVL